MQLRRTPLDEAPQRRLRTRLEQLLRFQLARQPARVHAGLRRLRLAQGAADRLRRGHDALHVHAEPAVDSLLDQLAADEHQQDRRQHRDGKEDEEQPHPQPRAQHSAPALHHHAHEVAYEDEDEDQQQAEVEDRQAEEEDRGQEVRRELPRLADQGLHPDQDEQCHHRQRQHEARVVPERRTGGGTGGFHFRNGLYYQLSAGWTCITMPRPGPVLTLGLANVFELYVRKGRRPGGGCP
jgi:hypothetical protein